MKESFLRIGGLPLRKSFLILPTSKRFWAHNFGKDWSTCTLTNPVIALIFSNDFLFDTLTLSSVQHLKHEWYIVLYILHCKISLIQQMQFLVKRCVSLRNKLKKILLSISEKAFKPVKIGYFINLTYGIDHLIQKIIFYVLPRPPLQESSNLRQSVRCYLNENEICVLLWSFSD